MIANSFPKWLNELSIFFTQKPEMSGEKCPQAIQISVETSFHPSAQSCRQVRGLVHLYLL